jgi:cell division topological specificity factor
MDLIERIFRRPSGSADIAKQRLQLVLTQDRTNISPETLNILKDEIVAILSKYIDIDADHVEVKISGDAKGHQLTANIPVMGRTPRPRAGRRRK